MKLLLNLGFLYLVNCASQHDIDDQLGLYSNNKFKGGPVCNEQLNKPSDKDLTSIDTNSDDDYMKPYVFKSPFSDPKLADSFDTEIEKCITKPKHIDTLFLRNKLECGVESMKVGMDQSELVRYSKRYILNLFHLPPLDKIQYFVTFPEDQFELLFYDLLRSIRVDPSNAALNGKEFIREIIDHTPNSISTIRTILSYYWSANSFRNNFLNRAFAAIAKSLSKQEYLEFESLLDWVQTEFVVMSSKDWEEVKLKFQSYYKLSGVNPKYSRAWYDMRPLKERDARVAHLFKSLPKPRPLSLSPYRL